MTKTELIQALAKKAEIDKKTAARFLEGLAKVVYNDLRDDGEAELSGLGKFQCSTRRNQAIDRSVSRSRPTTPVEVVVVEFKISPGLISQDKDSKKSKEGAEKDRKGKRPQPKKKRDPKMEPNGKKRKGTVIPPPLKAEVST